MTHLDSTAKDIIGEFYRFTNPFYFLLILVLLGMISSCKSDDTGALGSTYPSDIAPILNKSCATTGCHNAQSAPGAGGLNLASWSDLFEGSRGGSPVIPYAPHLSYLLFSVNTDSTLGSTLEPTMPFNQPALSAEEYATLWNWVYDGALNAEGEERFPPDPNRKKWYIGHQICDEVAVFDAESRQIMRFIDVGTDPISVEFVFDIQVSPDGKDWYVVFFGANEHISRYSTTTDEKVADIPLGFPGFSTLTFSPDSKFAFACSEYFSKLKVIDLQQNTTIGAAQGFDFEVRGPAVHPARQQVYLTQHRDKGLSVIDYDDNGRLSNERNIDLIQGVPPAILGDVHPFEILFLPDGSKYFVTCTHSHEVRVMDGQTDSLLEVINLPAIPSRMTYSAETDRLFVSCMDDLVTWAGDATKRGSIAVIKGATHTIERMLYSGFQPYSMAADDASGLLIVTNRNTDITGPVPHHATYCEGRNGYVALIDLNTLAVIQGYKPEILADPSTVAVK